MASLETVKHNIEIELLSSDWKFLKIIMRCIAINQAFSPQENGGMMMTTWGHRAAVEQSSHSRDTHQADTRHQPDLLEPCSSFLELQTNLRED